MAEPTLIGAVGLAPAIENNEDTGKRLLGLMDVLAFGTDFRAIEAAELLRNRCPATVHKLETRADSEDEDVD